MSNLARKNESHEDGLFPIINAMHKEGLPGKFIFAVANLAVQDDAIYELVTLWFNEEDKSERQEIIADLQDHIDDDRELPRGGSPIEKPKISFEDLDGVVDDIRKFKSKLKDIVDRNGGVSAVAKKLDMPQSSLSRLLNSGAMPRRSTLYKIAIALNLSEKDVATEWVK